MPKIVDIARNLGMTKQAILYHVKDDEIYKVDGVNCVDEEVEQRITKQILYKQSKSKNKSDETTLKLLERIDELEEQLRKQDSNVSFLQKQLNEKDNQLKTKDKQIEQFQSLLDKQQHIALDYIKKSEEQEKRIEHLQAPASINGVEKGKKRGLIGKLVNLI